MAHELIDAQSATFLTLTLNDYGLTKNGQNLNKAFLQKYFKRVGSRTPGFKYYAVGEYGTKNHRAHYHAIIFNSDRLTLLEKWGDSTGVYGYAQTDNVSTASIHYVTGYVIEKYGKMDFKTGLPLDDESGRTKPFAIMSKGLGKSYVEKSQQFHIETKTFETLFNGKKGHLSRYLKLKIFERNELIRLEVTDELNEKIKDDLKKKSAKGVYTARQYYKELIKQSQKKKLL